MKSPDQNPFDIVKANDFSDAQIDDYFVDFPAGASLVDRVKPRSKMPMIIFGGKGSGKTHLMRYLSYPLTLRQTPGDEHPAKIAFAGYLGIYFRCGGMNAGRFLGSSQPQEKWDAIFAFYVELWLAQLALSAVTEIYLGHDIFEDKSVVAKLIEQLDVKPVFPIATIEEFRRHLLAVQRKLDVAINNAALTGNLHVDIVVSRGKLSFGIPKIISAHTEALSKVLWVYLVDEFESLNERQQEYINTLLREREEPCTFKLGVRLYGLKTNKTLSGDEVIRENSEFEALRLDEELRARPIKSQLSFAEKLVKRRLSTSSASKSERQPLKSLESWFEADSSVIETVQHSFESSGRGHERQYFRDLRSALAVAENDGKRSKRLDSSEIERVIAALSFEADAVIERTNVFMFYRAWSRGRDLLSAAEEIGKQAEGDASISPLVAQRKVLKHFRSDIIAQLLRDASQPQRYVGFKTFVQMSAGLPRVLLTLLKHVYKWSSFLGEEPFASGRISLKAQSEAVKEASEWFFMEARSPGRDGVRVRGAMVRLGSLLRDIRFSDKPSECSLSTFSTDSSSCSEDARHVMTAAKLWSMLIEVPGGQNDRNTGRVDVKYQIHPMLAPRFDLPIARRGALSLAAAETNAIFAPVKNDEFPRMQSRRVSKMKAPFQSVAENSSGRQGSLL